MITACDAIPTLEPPPTASPALFSGGDEPRASSPEDAATQTAQPTPIPALDRTIPEEIVSGFLIGWQTQDFDLMYSLVSPQSKVLYPFDIFQNRYLVSQEEMNFVGIDFRISTSERQGTTAIVEYDLEINTGGFGTVSDVARKMRMVQNGNVWEIAWTPQDILEGLAGGVSISVQANFPPRAHIYDRNNQMLVEQGGTTVVLWGIKDQMPSVVDCINLITFISRQQRREVQRYFDQFFGETYFQIVEVDPETYFNNQAELNEFCGIFESDGVFNKVTQYSNRNYFGHGAAAHITGYIGRVPGDQIDFWRSRGYRASDIVGLAGIEFSYQDELSGEPERLLRMTDNSGLVIRELGASSGSPPQPVTLTIDRDLQVIVAQAVSDAFEYAANNWASVSSGNAVVVMDVNTGEVLALASYPTFDPSRFNPDTSYDANELSRIFNNPLTPLANKAVQEQYAPGSIYKIITTLAVGNEEIWEPNSIFECTHEWYGGDRFGDVLEKRLDWTVTDELDPTGPVDMAQALAASCDPYYYEMGALLYQRDPNLLVEYSESMGLGERTALTQIGSQAAGNLAPPAVVGDAINNAIGQGNVSVTAIQMVTAVASVANGGTLYEPHIVRQVGDMVIEPTIVQTLDIDPTILQTVQQGMCLVPIDEDYGTAYRIFGENPAPYTVCGKTGTAQAGAATSNIPPHAWFVSYAPADNPQIAIAVITLNSREGSEVSAPITRRILDYYFNAPIEPFPEWWEEEYVPVNVPGGGSAGG